MRALIALFSLSAVVGCAETHYIYTPQTANEVSGNLPATRTEIPQERPEGAVEVKTYGVTHLSQLGAQVPVLHVRMIVTNDGDDSPWQVDTRQQYVEIPGEGRSRAIYASSDAQALPVVEVPRSARHVFDLFFPLPAAMADAAHLPRFEVLWQVSTPARMVASRTAFDRMRQDPDRYMYDPYWAYAGFGPYGWYDPFYPSIAFVHAPPVRFHHHGSGHR